MAPDFIFYIPSLTRRGRAQGRGPIVGLLVHSVPESPNFFAFPISFFSFVHARRRMGGIGEHFSPFWRELVNYSLECVPLRKRDRNFGMKLRTSGLTTKRCYGEGKVGVAS